MKLPYAVVVEHRDRYGKWHTRSTRGYRSLETAKRACDSAAARNADFSTTRALGSTGLRWSYTVENKAGKTVYEADPEVVASVGELGYW